MMNDGPICWESKLQAVVALSTCEAEYIATSRTVQEIVGMRSVLNEIGCLQKAIIVYCDNQGAIAVAKGNENSRRTKHIDIKYHFIRKAIEDGMVEIRYIATHDMLADIMTKPLSGVTFEKLTRIILLEYDLFIELRFYFRFLFLAESYF